MIDDKKLESRNIIFHVIDGAFFMGAMVFLDQFTIMTAYIRQISPSPLIISLIPAAVVLGFNVPGLVSASIIQKIQNKHLFVSINGVIQRLMILLLGLFTLTLDRFSPLSAGLLSALFYFLFTGVGGVGTPAWLDLFSRTISSGKRARVVALRNALGAATGIVFPALIAYILKTRSFPGNYRILFFMAFGFLVTSMISFVMIKDHKAPSVKETSSLTFRDFIKELPGKDPNFIRFLFSRALFSFTLISQSFFTVYYLMQSGAEDTVVAIFALGLNVSKILGGLLLGFIGDRKGNLLVYKIGTLAVIPANILAFLFPSLPMFVGVFFLAGFVISADISTYQSFIGEFGTPRDRIYYIALGNSFPGIFTGVLPIAAGALLSMGLFSYRVVFLFCIVMAAVSFFFIQFMVKEPSQVYKKREEGVVITTERGSSRIYPQ